DPAFFATPRTITLTTGELAVTDDLTITGPGAAGTVPTLTIDGNAAGRVFNLDNPAAVGTVALSGMIVQNGRTATGTLPSPDGGGIFTGNENVTLDRMVVRNNTIAGGMNDSGAGVGVATNGNLVVRNTTISGNVGTGNGGGIYFF